MTPELRVRTRPAAGDAEGVLVLLHGRGSDEYDLEPLADALDPDRRLQAFLPRGPLALPPGGAHWYVVREIGFPDTGTFLSTFELVDDWLQGALEETGLGPEKLVLAGFSQGAVMSYALGLGAKRPCPGRDPGVQRVHPDRERVHPGSRVARGASRLDRARVGRSHHRRRLRP